MVSASGRHRAKFGVGMGVDFASTYIEAFHRSYLHKSLFHKIPFIRVFSPPYPLTGETSNEPQKTKAENPFDDRITRIGRSRTRRISAVAEVLKGVASRLSDSMRCSQSRSYRRSRPPPLGLRYLQQKPSSLRVKSSQSLQRKLVR